jgi:hypothetical protein
VASPLLLGVALLAVWARDMTRPCHSTLRPTGHLQAQHRRKPPHASRRCSSLPLPGPHSTVRRRCSTSHISRVAMTHLLHHGSQLANHNHTGRTAIASRARAPRAQLPAHTSSRGITARWVTSHSAATAPGYQCLNFGQTEPLSLHCRRQPHVVRVLDPGHSTASPQQ